MASPVKAPADNAGVQGPGPSTPTGIGAERDWTCFLFEDSTSELAANATDATVTGTINAAASTKNAVAGAENATAGANGPVTSAVDAASSKTDAAPSATDTAPSPTDAATSATYAAPSAMDTVLCADEAILGADLESGDSDLPQPGDFSFFEELDATNQWAAYFDSNTECV